MKLSNGIDGQPDVVGGTIVSNDAKAVIEQGLPYIAEVLVEGTSAILFHRWSDAAVEAKAKAAKGSAAKKTDDVESYVYRGPGE